MPESRRTLIAVAGVTVAVTAFATGVAVGAGVHRPAEPSVLDQALEAITARADAPVSAARLDSAAIQAMLASLDDRWASYYPPGVGTGEPDAIAELVSGRYSGLGVWLRSSRGGQVTISSVEPGSPAASAGLRRGDRVCAVDGLAAREAGLSGVVSALRGPVGSRVRLLVERAGVRRLITVRRAVLRAGNVEVETVGPGIVRIGILSFSSGVASDVAGVVRVALRHHVRGFVLDLRNDPGGLLSEGIKVASLFLNGGPVVTLSGRHVPTEVLDAPPGGDTTTPLAVLVNGGTASAAEVVAGALRERGRAVLVGSRTFGKGSVQEPIQLSDGAVIEVTVAHYWIPHGVQINGIGLTPDIYVPEDADPSVALTQAVRALVGLERAAGPGSGQAAEPANAAAPAAAGFPTGGAGPAAAPADRPATAPTRARADRLRRAAATVHR